VATETPKRGGPTLLGTTATEVYAASATATDWDVVHSITLVNEDDDSAHKVTLGIDTTPLADAAGLRAFGKRIELQPNETKVLEFWIPLTTGTTNDRVYGLVEAGAANLVTATVGALRGVP
jgi:hypothetical protein